MTFNINGKEMPAGKKDWGVIFYREDEKGRRRGHWQKKFTSLGIGGFLEIVETTYQGWFRRPKKEIKKQYIPPTQKDKPAEPHNGTGSVKSN